MELGGKLFNSLRIKTQFLERLQSVSVIDGATYTQKDDVESNRGSLENVAEIFILFLCGVQLVLMFGVLTIPDLDEVDVTPNFANVLGRCCLGLVALLVVGGAAEVLPVSLNCNCPLALQNPPPYISLLFLCFCSDGSNKHKIWAVGKSVFIWELGWEEPFGNYSTFSCFKNLEILHGHPFVAAYIHRDNA